jgi:hypothetical protein
MNLIRSLSNIQKKQNLKTLFVKPADEEINEQDEEFKRSIYIGGSKENQDPRTIIYIDNTYDESSTDDATASHSRQTDDDYTIEDIQMTDERTAPAVAVDETVLTTLYQPINKPSDVYSDGLSDDAISRHNSISIQDLLKTNTVQAVLHPAPIGTSIQCRIHRRKGFGSNEYTLCLENVDKRLLDLLVARKKSSNYVINAFSLDKTKPAEIPLARVKRNMIGSQFTVCSLSKKYDSGLAQKNDEQAEKTDDGFNHCVEYVSIIYNLNVLGVQGPRQMTGLFRFDHWLNSQDFRYFVLNFKFSYRK